MSGRAAALCQLESGALQPEEGSACGDRFIAKASSEDRRGHSPRTPRGGNTRRGETPHGEAHPPTTLAAEMIGVLLAVTAAARGAAAVLLAAADRIGVSPPLACILGMSRLDSTCIPPVSHHILGIPLYPCIYLHLAILQQIHCILLYLTVSSCIHTYLAVSSCVPLYLTVSHRLENGI